jgi:hypothetical protein
VLADPRYQVEQWAAWKAAFVRQWRNPSTWFSLMVGVLFLLLLWGTLFYMDMDWRREKEPLYLGEVRRPFTVNGDRFIRGEWSRRMVEVSGEPAGAALASVRPAGLRFWLDVGRAEDQ